MIWQKLHLLIKSESAHTELGSSWGKGKPRTWIVDSCEAIEDRPEHVICVRTGAGRRWRATIVSWSAAVCALVIFIYPFLFVLVVYHLFTFDLFNHILHIYELHWKLWWTQNFIWIFWLAEKFLTNITYTWVVSFHTKKAPKSHFCGVIKRETRDRC